MATKILHPKEDAYISQYYPNSNFGQVPYLYTNRYRGSGDDYQSLLRFFGGFNDKSKLRLKVYRNEVPSSAKLSVYRITDNWNESSVTWNNRPAIAAIPLGSRIVHAGYFGWVEIDIPKIADNLANYGILLKCEESVNSLLGFFGHRYNNSDYWPQLIVPAAADLRKPIVKIGSYVLPSDLIRVPATGDF